MRLPALALTATLVSGCAVTPTKRNALAPLPSMPPAFVAAEGLSVAGRAPLWRARGEEPGSAVSYPAIQPELGLVIRARDSLFMHLAVSLTPFNKYGAAEPDLSPPPTTPSWTLSTGVGYDLALGDRLGATVAGEVGLRLISVHNVPISGGAGTDSMRLTFNGSFGLAPHVDFGALRLFAGGGIAADTYSVVDGTVSGGCSLGCESGTTTTVGVGMVGAGARYRFSPTVAASLQAWFPFGRHYLSHPLTLTLTLHIGDFAVGSRKDDLPEPQGPPPPPYPADSPPISL
jgi:hypothetical protein